MTIASTTAAPPRVPAPHRRRLVAAAVGAGVAVLGTSACSAILPPLNLKPPSVSFSDLTIDSVNSERVRFTVKIATQNPNAVDLPLSNVYFDLAVLGQPLAQGKVAEQQFTLPANGARELPVSFSVASSDLRAVVLRLARGPAPDAVWELKGTANWGSSPLPIPFERRGDASSLKRLRELFGG